MDLGCSAVNGYPYYPSPSEGLVNMEAQWAKKPPESGEVVERYEMMPSGHDKTIAHELRAVIVTCTRSA